MNNSKEKRIYYSSRLAAGLGMRVFLYFWQPKWLSTFKGQVKYNVRSDWRESRNLPQTKTFWFICKVD